MIIFALENRISSYSETGDFLWKHWLYVTDIRVADTIIRNDGHVLVDDKNLVSLNSKEVFVKRAE